MCLIIQSCTGVADSKRQRGEKQSLNSQWRFFLVLQVMLPNKDRLAAYHSFEQLLEASVCACQV